MKNNQIMNDPFAKYINDLQNNNIPNSVNYPQAENNVNNHYNLPSLDKNESTSGPYLKSSIDNVSSNDNYQNNNNHNENSFRLKIVHNTNNNNNKDNDHQNVELSQLS